MAERSFRPIPRGIRGFQSPRCPICWMEARLCICDLLPRIELPVRLVIVMQWKESGRSSNTGRLANLVLPSAEVRLRGRPDHPLDLSDLADGEHTRILFPFAGASALRADAQPAPPARLTLVIPDGTWRQARRMVLHDEILSRLPAVRLPPGPPTAYRLRKRHGDGRLSTYESIARALAVLHGPEVERRMLRPFVAMVERTLWARGRLPADQVTGGIPKRP